MGLSAAPTGSAASGGVRRVGCADKAVRIAAARLPVHRYRTYRVLRCPVLQRHADAEV